MSKKEQAKAAAPWIGIVLALLQGLFNQRAASDAENRAERAATITDKARDESGAGYQVLVHEVESLYRQVSRLEDAIDRLRRRHQPGPDPIADAPPPPVTAVPRELPRTQIQAARFVEEHQDLYGAAAAGSAEEAEAAPDE